MKKAFLVLTMFLFSCGVDFTPFSHENKTDPTWTVCFSPHGDCTQRIVEIIGTANSSVYVQAYSFTSTKIAEALVAKKKQGKTVVVILDKTTWRAKGSVVQILLDAHIPVYVDDKHAIAHNKVVIIDDITVLTGSFNFTNAAENNNAENSLRLRDPALAREYFGNWKLHQRHSLSYGDL